MTDVYIIVFLYLAVVFFDMIPLIKKKKPMLFYAPVFIITFVINVLYGLGVKIPSPAKPISEMVGWIFGLK